MKATEALEQEERMEGADEEILQEEPQGGLSLTAFSMSQLPWWFVSITFHALAVLLLSLVSFMQKVPPQEEVIITTTLERSQTVTTETEQKRVDSPNVLASDHDTPPTDPTSTVASDIVVPPDILAKAELGDHFETINPDRPDTKSAFGNPDAHMFHSESGSDDAAGGGGAGGDTLEDVIGVGGGASPGTGGGWGGGDGTGIGVDKGSGRGSFGQRNGGGRKLMVMRHGGSRGTEGSVDHALKWLATHQEADGHWDCAKYDGCKGGKNESDEDVACTGFALLAFLGAGHTEKVGQYKDNVRRAVAWLKSIQQTDGRLSRIGRCGYAHAIAGMGMAEAAGMANVSDTKAAAQKAIDYSTNIHQAGEGYDKRGWRYNAKSAGDLSVTGWFVMQLKSAKVAGLNVEHQSFEGAIKFLDSCEKKAEGGDSGYGPASTYTYTPGGDHGGVRVSAIGNLCRQFLGWKKEDLQSSVQWFVEKGGTPDNYGTGKTDLYYWYYGTLCTFQQGGDIWKKWNDAMKKTLCDAQRKGGDEDGSWDPVGHFADRWGRVGQTALAALCLEVYYRYLPVYR